MESDFVQTREVRELIQKINREELTGLAAIRAVMETFPRNPDDGNYPLAHGSANGAIVVFEPRIPKNLPVSNRDGNWIIYEEGHIWASERYEPSIFCATLRAHGMTCPAALNTGWRNIRGSDDNIMGFAFGADLPVVVKALMSKEKGYIYVFLRQYFHADPYIPGEYICDEPIQWLTRIAVTARDLYPSPYLLPYTSVNPDAPIYLGDGAQGKLSDEIAVFDRNTPVPAGLHGVDFEPWQAPETLEGWRTMEGQYVEIDAAYSYHSRADKNNAVATVLFEQDGRFWVIARKGTQGREEYSLPEGLVEDGLPQQASAIKHANEALGLRAHLLDVAGDYDNEGSRARVYIARRTGGTIAQRLAEGEKLLLVPFAKASELLIDARDQQILVDVKEKVFSSLPHETL
jgi:ADP-ribose pyrophosphatase YjhB (NUDIX family)